MEATSLPDTASLRARAAGDGGLWRRAEHTDWQAALSAGNKGGGPTGLGTPQMPTELALAPPKPWLTPGRVSAQRAGCGKRHCVLGSWGRRGWRCGCSADRACGYSSARSWPRCPLPSCPLASREASPASSSPVCFSLVRHGCRLWSPPLRDAARFQAPSVPLLTTERGRERGGDVHSLTPVGRTVDLLGE